MGKINRDDMLELTRRMTIGRNCFHRIAGAYFDGEGFVEGTFNIHFQKLSSSEQESKLKLAKAIPFAETNSELKEYRFRQDRQGQGSVWRFLKGVIETELKNDAMLDLFYEVFGEKYCGNGDYGLYFFLGNYDIPRKGTDHVSQWESEEVYRFLIGAVCPVDSGYEPGAPECGFLFPAYKDRGGVEDFVNIYKVDQHPEILEILGV